MTAPPYQTASNSSVAAANAGAASGWRAGDVARVLPRGAAGLVGDHAAPDEVGHQRAVPAAQALRPATLRLEGVGLLAPLAARCA